MKNNRVIVSQTGSRRRYLIPQILEDNGLLECLYTDSYNDSCIGKIFSLLKRIGYENTNTNRLLNRRTDLPKNKVYANDFLQVRILWNRLLRSPSLVFKQLRFEGSSRRFIRRGCRNATILYNMFIENFDFALYAKKQGLSIICDVYENPYIFKELSQDLVEIPEYECISYKSKELLESHELRMCYLDRMLEIADAYLIPSSFVAESLKRSPSFRINKAHIIPYSSSINNKELSNTPQIGRIIWIGNDAVRKGLVYCERAAAVLMKDYPFLDFRIIGSVETEISQSHAFSHLNFIGHLNKDELANEFKMADIFVFPTLSEGFAGSLLEAASYGVPIITTHASGFEEDFPGVFIETRNTQAIIDAVSLLLEDRDKREAISQAVFEYSQSIRKDVFASRLVELINCL